MAGPLDPPANLDSLIEQLAAEPRSPRRRRLMMTGAEWRQPATVIRLYDEVVKRIHVDVHQANRLAQSAAWLSLKLGDESSRALALRAVGHILYLKRRYDLAWDHYQKAQAIYEGLGQELEVARTLNGGLQTLIYLGRYPQALESAQKAREIFARHGDRLRLARLDTNLGNLLFRQDRFDEALRLYEGAYATFLEVGQPLDVATALRNMATCQISLNDFHPALDTYRCARTYCDEHKLPLLAAEADYNIAYLYYLRGEYTRAMELYRTTREHCHSLGDLYHQGLCDLDQAEMYLELNLSEEGAYLAERALETFHQLHMNYEAAKATVNLAIASSHRGATASALELLRKARHLFTRERNPAWIATVDLYQALLFHRDQQLAKAWSLCETALEFFARSPLLGKAALCQMLLARIHLDLGRAAEAKTVCLAALHKLEQSETPALTWQAYFVLGTIEEALGDTAEAYQAYRKAYRQMEDLRSHLRVEEMQVAFLKDKSAVYESLVRLCLSGKPSPAHVKAAFLYVEQAKSRSLADLIAFRAHGIPPSSHTHRDLVDQVNAAREELHWYSRAMQLQEGRAANRRDPQLERLRRSARECERRLAEAMTNLRVADQEYTNLQAASSIELPAIQSTIPAGAMLVQYYRVQDTFYACLVTRKSLKIVPTGSAPQLRRELQLLRFQLSKFRLGADYVHTFHQRLLAATQAHLHQFYRQLVAPLEADLQGIDHLIVAPHGFLHYLPFHAVFDGEDYLDRRFSISYTPSASVYYLCSIKRRAPGERALVLGVPDPAAPQILDEVAAVSSALPHAEVHVDSAATYEILREKGSHSRFIHIATHGYFRQDNPMFSSISLGQSQLSLFDLYQLDLPAELITLSGCGTGLNVVVGGDEQLGLKRGLLYAGAQAVLLTLWDVNDRSTAAFMKLFYERLQVDPNKARAVQFAMSEIRRDEPHPFYWAPFLLVGKYDT